MPRRPVIVLIEDQPELSNVLRDVLDDVGYDVVTVRDQFAAIGHLREDEIDLVVSDLVHPTAGSLDPLAEIEREFPDLPLIVVKDQAQEDIPFFGAWRREGSRTVLRKPFRLDDLVGAARELVG